MTLNEVNKRLLEINTELREVLPKERATTWTYEKAFMGKMMHSGMGNQAAREAEAKLACDTDGLYEPMVDIRGKVRELMIEKEILIEYSKNLRVVLNGGEA